MLLVTWSSPELVLEHSTCVSIEGVSVVKSNTYLFLCQLDKVLSLLYWYKVSQYDEYECIDVSKREHDMSKFIV